MTTKDGYELTVTQELGSGAPAFRGSCSCSWEGDDWDLLDDCLEELKAHRDEAHA